MAPAVALICLPLAVILYLPQGQNEISAETPRAVMPTAASLFFGILTGALGLAYIVYGRRQARVVPVVSGVLLCGYTYFVDGWLWLCVIGVLLLAAPFVIDF